MSKKLQTVLAALESIAPLQLAEDWDNVGVILQPTRPRPIRRMLLTIDLTDAVLREAIDAKAQMIVAYHPPMFGKIRRMTQAPRIVRAIEAGLTIYSPHTALDAVPGGVNDWLCDGLGKGIRTPIRRTVEDDPDQQFKIVVFTPEDVADRLRSAMTDAGAGIIGEYTHCSFNLPGRGTFLGGSGSDPTVGRRGRLEHVNEIRMEMVASEDALADIRVAIERTHPYEEPAWEIYPLTPKPQPDTGPGRMLMLDNPVTLTTIVRRVKKHLGLKRVRVAAPAAMRGGQRSVELLGVCAGSGASVFANTCLDVYLTGEMKHHDVLAKVEAGSAVILTDHTNTERGYLPTLRAKLSEQLGKSVKIDISQHDADPLRIE